MSAEHSVQSDWEDIYNLIKDMNILFSFLLHIVAAYKKISLWTFAGFFSDTPSSFVAISSHSVRRSILTRPNTSLSNRRYSNHTITISFQPTEYMVRGVGGLIRDIVRLSIAARLRQRTMNHTSPKIRWTPQFNVSWCLWKCLIIGVRPCTKRSLWSSRGGAENA